jgi:SAM-dependent methyltransferase
VRWPRRRRPSGGRLPSLGQDYAEGHRRYVERLGPGRELWLRTKPFSAPPGYELAECLRTFAHIVERLDLDVRAQVLDVGCGPGWLSEFLARCGYWVTGVDVSEDMVKVARERIAAIDRPIGETMDVAAEFHAMPILELPWTKRFDAAILYDAMHHLDDEVETLRVIRRALVPGGRIFIHEGIRPEPGSEGERQLITEMEEYGTLESPFDPQYLVAVLGEAGFTDVNRFAAVDELLDVSAREEEVRRVESLLTNPPMNTVIARAPVPVGFAPDGASFAARIETRGSGAVTPGGDEVSAPITIANTGRAYWPAGTQSFFPHGAVGLGAYVPLHDGRRSEFPRQALPRSVSPGESLDVDVRVPRASIEGRNDVEVDLVREGIAWFANYGSTPLRLPGTVEG